jgi:hypothetical protein
MEMGENPEPQAFPLFLYGDIIQILIELRGITCPGAN